MLSSKYVAYLLTDKNISNRGTTDDVLDKLPSLLPNPFF